MGRVYIFNRNREHESSTVSVLLICQRTLIGALALLFYIARYKNLDYHQLVCLCVCWCACVSLSVSVCVSATIMMYFIWNGWAHAFASGASTAVNAMACKIWMRTMVSFSRTHTHTRFLRKIHADSLINLLFASREWVRKRKGLKSSVSNFLVAFSLCVCECVCVLSLSFLFFFVSLHIEMELSNDTADITAKKSKNNLSKSGAGSW